MKRIDTGHLRPFLILTFVISWGVPGIGLLLAGTVPGFPFSLEMYTPFYYLAVWGPAIAALIVIGRTAGARGVRRHLARLLDWRLGARWWLFALVGIPAMYFAGALVESLLLGTPDAIEWRDGAWGALLFVFLMRATAGPVEELGWRGFMQPLLQRRYSPITALIVLAIVHTVWHAPAFLIGFASDTHFATQLSFPAALARFGLGIVFITVFMNVAYNATGGRLTSAFLIHWMLNGVYPWEGSADLMTGQVIVTGVVAAVMLLASTRKWLRPENAATAVVGTASEGFTIAAGESR